MPGYSQPGIARPPIGFVLPDLVRVVVAIDPAVNSGEDADETGIIARSSFPPARRRPRGSGVCARKFDPDRRVIARMVTGPHIALDAGGDQAAGKGRADRG